MGVGVDLMEGYVDGGHLAVGVGVGGERDSMDWAKLRGQDWKLWMDRNLASTKALGGISCV